MSFRDEVTVTSEWLEDFAFKNQRTIHMRPTRAELQVGRKLFVAPLPLPNPRAADLVALDHAAAHRAGDCGCEATS